MDKVTTKNNTHELLSRLIVLCEMVRESLRGPPATARSRGRLVVLVDRAVEVALVDHSASTAVPGDTWCAIGLTEPSDALRRVPRDSRCRVP